MTPGRQRPFWYLRRRPDEVQADVDVELRAYLDMCIDDLVAKGMSAEAARREALRQFGDFEYARRYCRSQDTRKEAGMRWNLFVDELAHDLRHAVRQIVRTPGFTAIIVLTLALGIGANAALFSIFNSLILRPLPVRDPGSLAIIANGSWSYPIWDEIRARDTELFDGAFAWSAQRFDLSTAGPADAVDGAYVSSGFFEVLGITAVRGRMLAPADDGAAPDGPVAVISHRLWRQRFAGAPDVIGRPMTVQRVPFTIVGVMPEGFFGPDVGRMTDVILPVRSAEPLIRGKETRLRSPGSSWLQIMVRLKPGQSVEQASATLGGLHRLAEIESARTRNPRAFTLVPAANGNSALRRRFETPLRAMVIAVGLVLLVACGNIASLMLARTLSRRREFSVRLALGSSRLRIARLLFIESLLVAVMGAAAGLAFAVWSGAFLVQQLSTWQSSVSLNLVLDWRVLAFTAVLACLSAIVAGVVPAVGLTAVAPGDALKAGGRSLTGDSRLFLRSTLVVVQIAVSCLLVVGAGLFLRTFASLNQLPLGFVPEQLLVAELNLQAGGPPEGRAARVERLREAAAAVPGVRSATVASQRILSGGGWSNGMIGTDGGPIARIAGPDLWLNATTPGWFETMGIPLRSGRDFEAGDRIGSGYVAIVNDAFARRFLPGVNPIGHSVVMALSDLHGFDANARFNIVGVAGDAVYTTPREGLMPTMYVPMTQRKASMFWDRVALTIKAAPGQRATVEREMAAALAKADPSIAFTFGTFDQLIEATVTQERLMALLSAFFGGLALLLAALGLYGLVSHSVRARQVEIGLRMAMGADSSSIVLLVFRRVGMLIAAGLVLGLVGSLWGAKFVGVLLFQLEARDPMTFAGAAAVLVAVGLLAAWLPARRASRVNPIAALRGH